MRHGFKLLSVIFSVLIALSIAITPCTAVQAAQEETGVQDFFENVGDFFRDLLGKICTFFSIGFERIDMAEYTTASFLMPGLDEGFIPQGVCFIEKLSVYAVSGYVEDDSTNGKDCSRIYLTDGKNERTARIDIEDYYGHAGGIASYGDDVWICSGGDTKNGGYIYRFSADELASAFHTQDGYIKTKLADRFQTVVRASFLCCENGILWVGEFYNASSKVNKSHYNDGNRAWACGYNIPIDTDYESQNPTPDVILSIPDQVQGMAVTEDDRVIFSTSYGRRNPSVLYIFEDYRSWDKETVTLQDKDIPLYTAKRDTRTAKIKMPVLMEGIDCMDGKLCVIYESGAQKYADAKTVIRNAQTVEIELVTGYCEQRPNMIK